MTVIQRQCLLTYLGCYDGGVDGVWGARSRAGLTEFQKKYGLTGSEDTDAALMDAVAGKRKAVARKSFWDGIRYFRREEFRCRCGKCSGFPAEPSQTLVTVADRLRSHLGAAATVSSGVRCKAHNAAVGGVSGSRHLSGKAMDFSVAGVSSSKLLALIRLQPEIRYAYAIDGSFVHMDVE